MKKITAEAKNAFLNYNDYKKDNTIVEVIRQPHLVSVHMYLHGNEIARMSENKLTLDDCWWKTATTKERMNGILYGMGFYIKQKQGKWYLHDSEHTWDFDKVNYIDLTEGYCGNWYTVISYA